MGLRKYEPPKRESTLTKEQKDQVRRTMVKLKELWDKPYEKSDNNGASPLARYDVSKKLMYGEIEKW